MSVDKTTDLDWVQPEHLEGIRSLPSFQREVEKTLKANRPGDARNLIEDDKLLGQIPAIADGHWYAETDKQNAMASTNPTPLSIPVIVRDFLPLVVEALEG